MAATGCVRNSTAPSPANPASVASPYAQATLTVRVLTRSSEVPIEGASVRHEADSWITGPSGELTIRVTAGTETAVGVAAAGYQSMSASAVLSGDERWTFYLAPAQ